MESSNNCCHACPQPQGQGPLDVGFVRKPRSRNTQRVSMHQTLDSRLEQLYEGWIKLNHDVSLSKCFMGELMTLERLLHAFANVSDMALTNLCLTCCWAARGVAGDMQWESGTSIATSSPMDV
eukprot:437891-Amphidinium_carterae.1